MIKKKEDTHTSAITYKKKEDKKKEDTHTSAITYK